MILLIFITARLLSQDGSPYYPSSERGRASKYGLGDIYLLHKQAEAGGKPPAFFQYMR